MGKMNGKITSGTSLFNSMPISRKRVGTVMSVVEEDSASGFLQIRANLQHYLTMRNTSDSSTELHLC